MKFLEYIAPNWVAKRYAKKVKMELMRHKYDTIKHMNYSEHGASTRKNAFKGFDDSLHTADEDIGDNKEILMARSRQLYMGNSIALGAIRKLRTNIVGTGLKLKSKINKKILGLNDKEAQEIQENIQNLWELWANSTEPDITGQSNFYQLQSLAMLTQLVDGECFVALEYPEDNKDFFELKIKLIDSSRCVEPFGSDSKAKNGVELDRNGKPIAYWFVKSTDDTEPVRIEAFSKTGRKNILVLMEKERIGQRRGYCERKKIYCHK